MSRIITSRKGSAMNYIFIQALTGNASLTALNLVGTFAILFVLAVGIIYLKTLSEMTNLAGKVKNQGSNLDTLIWDMDYTRKKAIAFMQENNLAIPESMNKEPAISLGMNSASQIYNYKMMKDAEDAFKKTVEEHKDIVSERVEVEIIGKYDELEKDIAAATIRYNNAIKEYNTCLDRSIAHVIASHRGMRKKGYFRPEYAITGVVEIDG